MSAGNIQGGFLGGAVCRCKMECPRLQDVFLAKVLKEQGSCFQMLDSACFLFCAFPIAASLSSLNSTLACICFKHSCSIASLATKASRATMMG